MRIFLLSLLFILSIGFSVNAFATIENTDETITPEITSSGSMVIVLGTNTGTISSEIGEEDTSIKQDTENEKNPLKQDIENKKKEQEKTINDINTFLIESYKLKIDKILTNLNISIVNVTNNNPVAQTKLLEKIRGDVNAKIQIINSRNISENRKKILSSVFSYIQENLNAKISKLAQQR